MGIPHDGLVNTQSLGYKVFFVLFFPKDRGSVIAHESCRIFGIPATVMFRFTVLLMEVPHLVHKNRYALGEKGQAQITSRAYQEAH